jgi:hypothetical protein
MLSWTTRTGEGSSVNLERYISFDMPDYKTGWLTTTSSVAVARPECFSGLCRKCREIQLRHRKFDRRARRE